MTGEHEKFGKKSISLEQFKNGIKLVLKTDDEDLSFSTMSNMFYADYRPKYPEKSAADMTISYNWVTREGEIRGNLQALIPTIKKYNSFLFMLKDLKEMYASDMDMVIACAACGKSLKFGDAYTSRKILSNAGFGFAVCEDCYEKEFEK